MNHHNNVIAFPKAKAQKGSLYASIRDAANSDLVLLFGADKWPHGALMTDKAYFTWLRLATREERATHYYSRIDAEMAALLGLELLGSLEVTAEYKVLTQS